MFEQLSPERVAYLQGFVDAVLDTLPKDFMVWPAGIRETAFLYFVQEAIKGTPLKEAQDLAENAAKTAYRLMLGIGGALPVLNRGDGGVYTWLHALHEAFSSDKPKHLLVLGLLRTGLPKPYGANSPFKGACIFPETLLDAALQLTFCHALIAAHLKDVPDGTLVYDLSQPAGTAGLDILATEALLIAALADPK